MDIMNKLGKPPTSWYNIRKYAGITIQLEIAWFFPPGFAELMILCIFPVGHPLRLGNTFFLVWFLKEILDDSWIIFLGLEPSKCM